MSETIVENKTGNIYGITPEIRAKAREKLERLIEEKGLKPFSTKDFRRSFGNEQTQAEIQAEVDDFLRTREKWREEDRKLGEEREIDDFAG